MDTEIQRPDIYEALKDAVIDGLAVVRDAEKQGRYISRYRDFPQMSEFLAWPSFSNVMQELAPLDYSSVFEKSLLFDRPSAEDLPSWQHFLSLARGDSYLRQYWTDDDLDMSRAQHLNMEDFFETYYPLRSIKELVNRYVHLTSRKEFDESLFRPIYLEWERATLSPMLPFDVFVPIIFSRFSFDVLDLDETLRVVRMSDDLQLARNTQLSGGMSAHKVVVSCATHALEFRNWEVANASIQQRTRALYDPTFYKLVIEKIDSFFVALKLVAGVDTGYSQIVARPTGWADSWTGPLLPTYVTSIKAYPDKFERYRWLELPPPSLAVDLCHAAYDVYNRLNASESKRLSLATRRLNRAFLRGDEEDSILDVTIGLESLFSDDNKSEVTYKLKMRLAALSKIEPHGKHSPAEVFALCGKVYDFRSAVVHGSRDLDKKRVITVKETATIPTVALGIDLLAFAIQVLSRNPQYLEPGLIDQYLLESESSSPETA